MALTMTTADSALKEWYLPAVRYQLNNDTPMLNIIGKKNVDIEGRRAVLSLQVSRNSAVAARAEGGTLPTAGNQQYAEERVSLKNLYATIQVSGQTIKQMDSAKAAFVRAVESEMTGALNDLKRDVNRQIWGTSDGIIATCAVGGPSTTVQLNTATPDSTMRQFYVGQVVDIATVAQAAAGSGGKVHGTTISAINTSAKTITIGSSITTAVTDFVFTFGNGGSAASGPQKELTGLQTIVSNGNLFNITVATVPVWQSVLDANGGTQRSISENLLAKNVQEVQVQSGEWPTHIVTSLGVHRAFAALLQSQKRYPNTRELPGGYTGLDFAAAGKTIPVIYDRDCPSGTSQTGAAGGNAFILNANHVFLGAADDWDWMDKDGAVLSRVANQDNYSAVLFRYCEQFCDQRNVHARISDLIEA